MTRAGYTYIIDWQRRRLLPTEAILRCVHGEYLVHFCRDCQEDLEALSVDLLP